jgi:hypothetical protein
MRDEQLFLNPARHGSRADVDVLCHRLDREELELIATVVATIYATCGIGLRAPGAGETSSRIHFGSSRIRLESRGTVHRNWRGDLFLFKRADRNSTRSYIRRRVGHRYEVEQP